MIQRYNIEGWGEDDPALIESKYGDLCYFHDAEAAIAAAVQAERERCAAMPTTGAIDVWCVCDPEGDPELDSIGESVMSALDATTRFRPHLWKLMESLGYTVRPFKLVPDSKFTKQWGAK